MIQNPDGLLYLTYLKQSGLLFIVRKLKQLGQFVLILICFLCSVYPICNSDDLALQVPSRVLSGKLGSIADLELLSVGLIDSGSLSGQQDYGLGDNPVDVCLQRHRLLLPLQL